ncbi:hypothetical protein RBB50_011473 [Rhinocladiella similis]
MTIKTPWSRLIRFIAPDDQIYYGDVVVGDNSPDFDVGAVATSKEPWLVEARVVEGNPLAENCKVTDRIEVVKKLLGPLTKDTVSEIRCIGGNYAEHLNELEYKRPFHPIMFPKFPNAVSGFQDDVVIPRIAQDDQADYEIELAVVIGKEAKNVSVDEAYDYVLGYTVANDVSTRKWQLDPKLSSHQPQMSFSKSFDGFLPLGPCIVSAELIKDPHSLTLETRINREAELRQNSSTKHMIFSVPELIAHCSQGTTIQAGSILTTGTPSGVGYRMDPPRYLRHGDKVQMTIQGIGMLEHGIVYE